MRLNRKVTFVLCTVGRYVPDGFDSWEDVYDKGVYIYIYICIRGTYRDNANERNMSKRWFFLRIDT